MLGGCATALELYAGMLKPSDTRRNSKSILMICQEIFGSFLPEIP